MEKIPAFQITGITLAGFKGYCDPVEFIFGNPTVITGGNGRGKSSIADAISFAVTGLPFFGERGLDRLHNDEQRAELFVALRYIDAAGAAHELTRTRFKGRMSITLDSYEIRQYDLTDLFGEKDVFLSIFNPLYFIEELGDNGKHLLERHLPSVSHEAVLAGLNEDAQASLREESMLSPEGYLKRKREEIRELEDRILYLTGQKDLVETQEYEGTKQADALSDRLSRLAAEQAALEEKRYANLDPAAMRESMLACSARYEELTSGPAFSPDGHLQGLYQKLERRRAEQYAPKYTRAACETEVRIQALANRYHQELGLARSFAPGMACPSCRRAITEQELPALRSTLQSTILEIATEGKEQTAQLAQLQELEQKSEATFHKFQSDDVTKLEAELQSLTDAPESSSDDWHGKELELLRQQIQSLTSDLEYGNLKPEEYDRLKTCREDRQACEAELAARQSLSLGSADEYDSQIEQVRQEIKAKRKCVADAALYVGRRAEMLFSHLKMNRVAISLYDVVKSTGEIKDAFRFTYNGRLYDRLSLSEKIRAGMEVSELMKRLAGRNYPVFLDNMESVEDLANVRPTGQVIMAKCIPHGELLVNGLAGSTPKQAQAA